ncbi:SUF system Fe-S cluster assembly regulator [Corallococcus carmarthensis]|uniref:SUF system Fe-S cluster assembly regulator n=1 Tax=Corallococcus carmarthensis TaxID=2316728 RepID=A0A3A8JMA0_9BACT|nr:SUF system Fe-S cluster assembly regulator [Corallococcus carmarthensis]NOK21464.1 SUF system Fe-S cluster assembly regulator [Corallococcus carmarthensis]RKG96475.1 SUF system Fe-S cluster assembly regulator [Corallococcus carmarthensis]
MLRMSKMTDYGIVLMAELARADGETRTTRELAARTRVSLPSASKVLKGLLQAGLVVSHRGANGGYGLSRPAEAISLAELVTALEGPVSLTECGQHQGKPAGPCELESVCQVRGHWRLINQAIQEALGRLTLADLRAPVPRMPERLVGLGLPASLGAPPSVTGVRS